MGLAKRDPRGTGKGGSYAAEAVKRGDIPSIDQHQVEELADERKDAPRYLQSTTSSRIKSAPKVVPECRATPRLSVDLGKENSGPRSCRDKQGIKTQRESRSRARSRSRKIVQAPTQDPKSNGRPPLKPADLHMNESAQRKPHVSKKDSSRQRKKGVKPELRTALDSIDSDISQVQREIEALDPHKKETSNDRRRPFAAMTSSGREMAYSTSSMISWASSSCSQTSRNEENPFADSADWRARSLDLEELGADSIEATYARTVSRARSVKLLSLVESEDPHLEDNRRFIEKQRQRLERSGSSVHDAASAYSTVRLSASAWAAQAGRSTAGSVSSLIAEDKAVQVTVSTDTADALWAEQSPNALWAEQSPDTGSSQSIVSPSLQMTKDVPESRRSPPSAPPGSPGSVVSFSSVRFRCRRRRVILRDGDAAL